MTNWIKRYFRQRNKEKFTAYFQGILDSCKFFSILGDVRSMNDDIRICFIGDSLVNCTGDETCLGWAGRLCMSAIKSGYRVTYYNMGIRRDTSHDILMRLENECLLRLPMTCDARMVISCGVNDTVLENGQSRVKLKNSRNHIQKILTTAKSKYKVIMVGPAPVNDNLQNKRIQELNDIFSNEANLIGIPYIETFSLLEFDDSYRKEISLNDGSHPGSEGYIKLANIIRSSNNWWFRQAK